MEFTFELESFIRGQHVFFLFVIANYFQLLFSSVAFSCAFCGPPKHSAMKVWTLVVSKLAINTKGWLANKVWIEAKIARHTFIFKVRLIWNTIIKIKR